MKELNKEYESIWSKAITFKEQKQIFKRIFKFVLLYKREFIASLFGALLVSVINILLPRFLQYYLDHFLAHKSATWQIIYGVAAIYLLGLICKALLQFFYEYYYSLAGEKTLEKVRRVLYQKLHQLGMHYFDETPAGSILSRVTNDTMTLSTFLSMFSAVMIGIISMITAFVAMYYTDKIAGLIILAFLPVLLLIMWLYSYYNSRLYREYRERNSLMNTKLNETITGINVIQQFRQEKRIQTKFEDIANAQLKTRMKLVKMNALLLSPLTSLLYNVAIAISLIYFGFPTRSVFVAAGVIYAFSNYIQSFFNPISSMMDSLTSFTDGIVAGKRIFKILDEDELEPQQKVDPKAKIELGKIEFKHVSFSYDGKNDVLHDISFTLEPGQTLGIVGHTDSGKSSIINIMMRFYEFHSGEILLDGHDIRSFSPEELRKKLGLVLQEPFMFYGDIKSNIRLYNQEISDKAVIQAAKQVQADGFIEQLPDKYDSKVIEGGSEFSSGQRQLISFARTLVTNPKILVLDEATANVDTETETLIQKGLKQLRQGRTTLAIAHRLSTIKDADKIIVLDKGRIVEMGNHEELLNQKGYYYDLYRLQQDRG
ncbi:ABC transporter ATP-binding protein [Lactobacillus jensenii]|uniref:ABC transporter ATP-binding protein n=1 Tax=Lactobacillus jensenii TaxID=109790 RepID=UPI0029C11CE4|nr:ABC transporter ATP-binding protein [Lactobacillus jensenii]MDX5101965.1 ABC transporter ATP-binding protein [Lactobacillus jensenii]MDX5103477.1 ABC transporter ATP-binding protein [Lactobacillus jensenii]MDX5114264.1 ABC transporter ATP-binding protein [Lactobacillus jensenii]